jgi:pyruvate-formate lyase
MTATVTAAPRTADAWRQFSGSGWRERIDVRDFIQANYTPYEGGSAFLTGPTERTLAVWGKVAALFPEERRRGVLDVDPGNPSTITSHRPGYIDRDRELIVGLQTDAPLRRAIMPNGGLRMVENGLKAYGYKPDPFVTRVFGNYRKTHNDEVKDDFFSPKTVKISKGSKVTWTWKGDNPHDVKFKNFGSPTKTSGTYSHRFKKKGTFKYVCRIHSGMTGKVVVS